MTGDLTDATGGLAVRRPGSPGGVDTPGPRTTGWRSASMLLGCLAALATLALCLAWQLGWAAPPRVVLSTGLLAVLATWPVHERAVRGVASGRLPAEGISSLAMILGLVWAVALLADEPTRSGPAEPAGGTMNGAVSGAMTSTLAGALTAVATVALLAGLLEHLRLRTSPPLDPTPVWLLPATVGLALVTFVGWVLGSGDTAGSRHAVAVLVAACPAMLLCTAIVPMILLRRRAADLEVVLPGGAALAVAGRVTTLVLDKDGSVTTGALRVLRAEAVEPDHDRNLKWFAGALAHGYPHPVGKAIAKLAGRGNLTGFQEHSGAGISGSIDRHPVRVGRPDWVHVPDPGGPGTTFGVEVDGRALGHITLVDEARPDAAPAIARLGQRGVAVTLVSDAEDEETALLATDVAAHAYVARATSDRRVDIVTAERARGEVVAYLGAGPANLAALRAADVGISTTAGEDTTILTRDPSIAVATGALDLARAAARPSGLARGLALVLMVVPALLAAVGLIGPAIAAAVTAAGTVLVVLVSGSAMRAAAPPPSVLPPSVSGPAATRRPPRPGV